MFRAVAVLMITLATCFFSYWGSVAVLPLGGPDWIRPVVCLLFAGFVAWFVWGKLSVAPDGLFSNILFGAIVLGSIGFVGGFFGPIILTPHANQGPLLGIFITGPLGCVLGGIAGLVFSLVRPKHKSKPGSCRTCDYDLTGNRTGVCPECGAPTGASVTP